MKKLIFLILPAALITAPALASIPPKVTDAFQARYATATNVEWKHGIGSHFKASFNLGEYRLKAKFDRKGNWLESEKIIAQNKLPMTVKNNLRKSKYGDWKIKSSYEEYLPNEKPQYHITAAKGSSVTKGFMTKSLTFDHHGQLMNG